MITTIRFTSFSNALFLHRALRLWIFGALALLISSRVQASIITLPIGGGVAMITQGSNTLCSDNEAGTASCSYGGASASAVAANGSGGLATASAGTNASLVASASSIYLIAVQGPSSVNVPIIINGTATTQDNGSTNLGIDILAIVSQSSPTTQIISQYFADSNGCAMLVAQSPTLSCTAPGAFSLQASLTSNVIYSVQIDAGAAEGGNASATIDPSIEIDPSFPLASEFTLVASPGVFNSIPQTQTPEPGGLGFVTAILSASALLFRKTLSK